MKELRHLDEAAWDQISQQSLSATFFHTPEWSHLLERCYPGTFRQAPRFFESNAGDPIIFPCIQTGHSLKGAVKAFASNPFGVYGGPIAAAELDSQTQRDVLAGLVSARTEKVELFGNPHAPSPEFPEGWTVKEEFTHVLRLNKLTISKGLPSCYAHLIRNNVHRAEKRGYLFSEAQSESEIEEYFALYQSALKRYGSEATGGYPYLLFQNLFRSPSGKVHFWLLKRESRIVGGVLGLAHNKGLIAWNAAFAEEEFPFGVSKYLHHRVIMQALAKGFEYYDLNPSGGHEGTVRFKEMLGAEKITFRGATWSNNRVYRLLSKARSLTKHPSTPPPAVERAANPHLYNVAHFRTPYLARTETFIYSIIKNLRPPFLPTVFTSELANQDQFPFERIVNYGFKKKSLRRLLNGFANRLYGTNHLVHYYQLNLSHVNLIHAHFGPEGWALLTIKKSFGVPLITTFYGYDASLIPREPGWMERYAQLFKEGDLFLTEGPYMKKTLIGLGCPEEKIKVQRIAIDLDKHPLLQQRAKTNEKTVFLFCGRFIEKKGLIYALQAFEQLVNKGITNFEFRVIGDGPLMPSIKQFLSGTVLNAHVTLLGYRTHAEFQEELRHCDIFISPSVTAESGDNEGGCPTTLIEAQASGRPVISTLHADIPEIVLHGKTGLLSAERDVEGLKENIAFLMMNPDKASEFGRAGRLHIEENHDIKKEIKKLEEIYLSVLKPSMPHSLYTFFKEDFHRRGLETMQQGKQLLKAMRLL